jgi:hypothetical protein
VHCHHTPVDTKILAGMSTSDADFAGYATSAYRVVSSSDCGGLQVGQEADYRQRKSFKASVKHTISQAASTPNCGATWAKFTP